LKLGAVSLVFPWTKVDEESLCRAKRYEASESGKEEVNTHQLQSTKELISRHASEVNKESFPKTMVTVEAH